MRRIVSMGRGGSGKTSFVALMTKHFIETSQTPLLLVDLDPDQNLSEMVGIDLREKGIKTISDLLQEAFIAEGGTTVGIAPSKRIESKIWEAGLYEGNYFDLTVIGTKWFEGCYCLPNRALKEALRNFTKTYQIVLIDSPAGLEHLNRRVASEVEDIFDIMDPSKKSFDHIRRAYDLAKEVNIQFENFYILGGYRFPEELAKKIEKQTELKYLGKIAYDDEIEEYNLAGKPLLDLPSSSKAYQSVRQIMKKAGYF